MTNMLEFYTITSTIFNWIKMMYEKENNVNFEA